MQITTLALFVGGFVAAASAAPNGPQLVVGGQNATKARTWMVAFKDPDFPQSFCGGALIAPDWVLTTGHCIISDPVNYVARTTAWIGGVDVRDASQFQIRKLAAVYIYPYFNQPESDATNNDIAMVKLASPVSLRPIKVNRNPNLPSPLVTGVPVNLLGWGDVAGGLPSYILQFGRMQSLATATCQQRVKAVDAPFKEPVQSAMCTEGSNTTAGVPLSCAGDSGGPYFVGDFDTATVVGLVSFGPAQCRDPMPPGYHWDMPTRVSYYYNWIQYIMFPNQYCGILDLGPSYDASACMFVPVGSTCSVKCLNSPKSVTNFKCTARKGSTPVYTGHPCSCPATAVGRPCYTTGGWLARGSAIYTTPSRANPCPRNAQGQVATGVVLTCPAGITIKTCTYA